MKHILTLALAVLTALTTYAYDFSSDGVYYRYVDKDAKTVEVTYQSKNEWGKISNDYAGTVNIPSTVTDAGLTYTVVAIGDSAFIECYDVTGVTLPSTLTRICNEAFFQCEGLESVTIPEAVTWLGRNAFSITGLTSVVIPDNVRFLGEDAFSECQQLASVTIGSSVDTISDYAFYAIPLLTSINIPASVRYIGKYAINKCNKMASITVAADNNFFASVDGVLYNKDVTTLIQFPDAKPSVTIPSTVTTIGLQAFYNTRSLVSIEIPSSVTTIEPSAFASSKKLASVTLPSNLTRLGNGAFYMCRALTAIQIPSQLEEIESTAFGFCTGLKDVTIPQGVKKIGESAFFGCTSLASATIGSTVDSIGVKAFENCTALKAVTCDAVNPPVAPDNTFASVTTTTGTLTVPENSLQAYKTTTPWSYFANISTSGIEDIAAGAVDVYATQGVIHIQGLAKNTSVRLYSADGKLVTTTRSDVIQGLARGLYLLKTASSTFKVVVP